MNAEEKKLGKSKLVELTKSSTADVQSIADARKNTAIRLRSYGRRWHPSHNEQFEVDPELAQVRPYKRSAKSTGIELYMHSSVSGWGFYPVEWTAMLPDVQSEKDQLLVSECNNATTGYGDSLDRAQMLVEFRKFRVEVITLHGPTWETDANNNPLRVADREDKPNREVVDYYKIVKL